MTIISKLGDDVLGEILIRSFSNPRPACRSKVVCKRWKTLISSPRFNRRFVSHHQNINEAKPPLLLASNDPELSVILGFIPRPHASILYRPEYFMILDSFDDLLLCGFGVLGQICSNAEILRSYLLCNSFTKQCIALPFAPERPDGYTRLVASLVCEPRNSNSIINLDLGDGQAFAHGSVYRFRVVCMYQHMNSMKLDVFCSESGEWTKEALILDGILRSGNINVVSCNGVVFLPYVRAQTEDAGVYKPLLAAINPFHLDVSPTLIDVPLTPLFGKWFWNISVSKDAFHMIVYEEGTTPFGSRIALSVWRLDEDRKFWSKTCEGQVKPGNYDLQSLVLLLLCIQRTRELSFSIIWLLIIKRVVNCPAI